MADSTAPVVPLIADFPGRADLSVAVPVDADQPTAFAAITQWEQQGRWMIATRVWVTRGDGRGVGDALAGFTGIGPLGFLDTMDILDITDEMVVVAKTGRVVRGAGWMGAVDEAGRTSLVWGAAVALPAGPLGRIGWLLLRPVITTAFRASLRRLARQVAAGQMPVSESAEAPVGAAASAG